MKTLGILFCIVLLAGAAFFLLRPAPATPGTSEEEENEEVPAMTVVAKSLEIPWDIAFLPEGGMLVSERPGRLLLIENGGRKEIAIEGDVLHRGEGGLLGITLHPDFKNNHFLYLYFSAPGENGQTKNRVERYAFDGETLSARTTILSGIPGALYHDGGRMEFGPDGYLYIATGDATKGQLAQDPTSLAGKILRVEDDGSIPANNPSGTAIYSSGHRNPQGLAWDAAGRLWETEHGPTGEKGACCHDEINLIKAGGNYGWPLYIGDESTEGTVAPALHSGTGTWAPASAAIVGSSLFFGGLRGEALYEATLDGERVVELKEHFKGEFGRIRTVRVGPDGMLYLTTSNRDGRGQAASGDDKILKVNPESL